MPAVTLPPSPKGHFFTGHFPEFARERLAFFTHCAREHGDVVLLRLGPIRAYLLSHPDFIEDVLVTHNQNFTKHYALKINALLLGKGLLTSEGDFWLRQRRLIQPAFLKSRILTYGPDMIAFAERMAAGWHDGRRCDIHTEMTRLTLEIAVKTLFGGDIAGAAAEVGDALHDAMKSFDVRINSMFPLPRWVPTPSNRRSQRACRRLDEVLYRIIQQRRQGHTQGNDLLSILLEAHYEDDGSVMTDKQLRDEAMTLFLAGHETTALTLSWTFYLLAKNPAAEALLHAELYRVLGGRAPTTADLAKLTFTENVVTESMRLYPPAYTLGREAVEPFEVGGYRLPAGATVFLPQWVVHRDRRWYDDPERFDPDRWAGEAAERLPRFAYFPFGGGPRLCVGNSFAMVEAVLVLATLARQFRFELDPNHSVEPWPSMTLRPRHGIKGVLRRR